MSAVATRTCGKCTACCTALIVAAVPKKEWERCKHLGKFGCKIYKARPEDCAGYACAWLQGAWKGVPGDREMRPDRLGVIFSPMHSEDLGNHTMVHEIRPGALNQPNVKRLIELLCRETIVFHIRRDSMRRLLGGPPAQLEPLLEKARKLGILSTEPMAVPEVAVSRLTGGRHE